MGKENKNPAVSRRKFLGLLGLAGGSIVASSLGGVSIEGDLRRTLAAAAGTHDQEPDAMKGGTEHKKRPPRDISAPFVKKDRQWVFVVDLKKCDGCESLDGIPKCTEACIKEHHVPTGDNGQWIQEWIQTFKMEKPEGGTYWMPMPCMQCENAPCTNVCPVGATYHNREGIVLIDHRRCIGCRLCMAACPYSRRFFNWNQPHNPPEATFSTYTPEFPVPFFKGTVVKCIFCAHNVSVGKLPFCVAGCPMHAIYLGDLNEDRATNGIEVVALRSFLAQNNAYRYKEELGTEPRVYYLPGHGQEFGRRPL